MGADEVLLLDDVSFLDGDGYSTARALSKAVAMEPFELVFCGKQAIDDDRGEVGPMVAQFLDLPHVGNVVKVDIVDGKAVVASETEGGKEIVEVLLPAVLTAQRGLNEPRVPMITGVMKAMKAQIPRVTPEQLGLEGTDIGAAGAKSRVEKYIPPKKRPEVRIIPGDSTEAAAEAVRILVDVERIVQGA
jgi:electron transfer flavoprotein beta subunit